MNLLQNVVCEIADQEGVDAVDLTPPLHDVIDVEALELLVNGSESRDNSPGPTVEFEYCDYTVTIDESRHVSIRERTEMKGEPRRKPDLSREASHAAVDKRAKVMRDAGHVLAARDRPFGERLDGLLEVIRLDLGMEYATLSYVDGDSYVFEAVDVVDTADIEPGDIVPIEETVCKRVIETEQPLVLTDVDVDAPELAGSATGLSSYIGVPVFVDGDVHGTFCFYDSEPRSEEFTEWDLGLIEVLANWVSSELEQRARERSLHAATNERPYVAH